MTKTLIYTFIILTSTFYVKAQETSTEKELQSLENIDQAKNYLEKKSSRKNKLLVFSGIELYIVIEISTAEIADLDRFVST